MAEAGASAKEAGGNERQMRHSEVTRRASRSERGKSKREEPVGGAERSGKRARRMRAVRVGVAETPIGGGAGASSGSH